MTNQELLEKIQGVGFTVTKGIPKLDSAYIKFSKITSFDKFGKCFRKKRFSCIDIFKNTINKRVTIVVSASATCVDEKLGSVFGISATRRGIVLVPQHRMNLESFVDFYLGVTEFDPKVELMKHSEYLETRDLKLCLKECGRRTDNKSSICRICEIPC